ncbi:MAG: hypothetical protein IT374_03150 [Polyangiaceae bacterium]|nr:hypothetical protein [Polyangiaceae bacterium]
MRWSPALLVVLAVASVSARARADEVSDFEEAVNAYDRDEHALCVLRFTDFLARKDVREARLVKRSRMYLAACLLAQDKATEAAKAMESLVLDDPNFRPDPAAFSRRVLDQFARVRARMTAEIERIERERLAKEEAERKRKEEERRREALRLATLERLAREEYLVKRNSRVFATVPFGVGQLQNGQRSLGLVFMGAEAAFATASVVTYFAKESIEANYVSGTSDRAATIEQRDRLVLLNRLAFGAFVATAVGGVVHAHLTFVPEVREVRPRPLPELSVVPEAALLPGGVALGARGSF